MRSEDFPTRQVAGVFASIRIPAFNTSVLAHLAKNIIFCCLLIEPHGLFVMLQDTSERKEAKKPAKSAFLQHSSGVPPPVSFHYKIEQGQCHGVSGTPTAASEL